MDIYLNPQLTDEQQRLVIKYIERPSALSRAEWLDALLAFDLLRTSVVTHEGQTMTFGAFYERFVDAPFAERFLTELMRQDDVEAAGGQLTVAFSREIRQALNAMGLREPTPAPMRLLLAYCLYWWASFAKGYVLEVAVYRDLEQAGIVFQAHDLLHRAERFTPFDVIVSGQEGDIKASTYFLRVARGFPLRCAFYIARAFDTRTWQWRRVVLLKRAAWDEIDGETVLGTLEHALTIPPTPVEITVSGEALVVIDYEVWKQKIRTRQMGGVVHADSSAPRRLKIVLVVVLVVGRFSGSRTRTTTRTTTIFKGGRADG
jgi:hypothetical protein